MVILLSCNYFFHIELISYSNFCVFLCDFLTSNFTHYYSEELYFFSVGIIKWV